MSRRRAGRGSVSLLWALALGCGGDDDSAATPIGPSGDVELEISGFLNDQGQEFAADADSVTLSCDGSINVQLGPRDASGGIRNWLLRPPGTCESFEQCGYVQLTLVSESGVEQRVAGATTTLRAPAVPGEHDLTAQLLTDDAEPFLQDELPVQANLPDVVFTAPADCDASATSSGGSGGSSGAGGSGGSGASGGSSSAGGAAGAAGAAASSGTGEAGAAGAAGAAQG